MQDSATSKKAQLEEEACLSSNPSLLPTWVSCAAGWHQSGHEIIRPNNQDLIKASNRGLFNSMILWDESQDRGEIKRREVCQRDLLHHEQMGPYQGPQNEEQGQHHLYGYHWGQVKRHHITTHFHGWN